MTVSTALRDWAAGRDATIRPPSHGTPLRGRGGGRLIPVVVEQSDGRDPEQLYVKVLSAGQASEEAARHRRAVGVDAGFAERHLVRQPYPRYPVGDGRHLMFQDVARGAERVVPLAEVSDDQLRDAYRALLDGVWGWHRPGRRISQTSVGQFVRQELTDAGAEAEVSGAVSALGLGDLAADWLYDPALGLVLPNPLRFADAGALFHDHKIDRLSGASHGDLHGRNVLFPCSSSDRVQVRKFCLVDTDRFAVDAPLTRDLVTLLLDFVLPEVAGAPRTAQADALLALLVDPSGRASDRLPALATKVIKASHTVGSTVATKGNWGTIWRAQYLLSLLSHALICCTYEDAGPTGRAWYFRLAAHAAHAYRQEFRPGVVPPPAAGLPTLPGAAPHLASPANDRSARFDAAGPQPSQQNRAAPLDRTPLDQTRPPPAPEAPAWPWGSIPIQQRPSLGGWHGAPRRPTAPPISRPGDGGNPPRFASGALSTSGNAPISSRPGAATGNAAGATRAGASGWPPIRDGERPVNRPAPRYVDSARTNAIPRPRRPAGEGSTGVPAGPGRISRLPPKLRAVLAILLGGVSLTPLVAVYGSGIRGRDETPVAPTSEASPGAVPSAGSTPTYAGSTRRLADLALTAAGITPTATEGAYTVSCLRVWAPEDLAPGLDRRRYRDEQLWWTAALSGHRIVTLVTSGRRSGQPTSFRYGLGELSEIPPVPSVDPVELRRQLAAQLGELPPELRNAAGMLNVVVRIFRYHLLSPRQISALLFELAATPGIQDRGAYPDWNDRPGLAFSADDSEDRRETVQFDAHTGELLSHETTTVTDNRTLDYVLFLHKERTNRTTGPGCA
ncbi:hypothetical protein [Micromonospora sp. NPDC048898]|uniref:hypothetical protein n=1 Tax=Micromonospora sp. NPDC048898 TaxID=3364260 RepID=UPI003719DCC0